MKPIKDYFKNKELKVEYLNAYNVVINRELLLEIIKEIQTDTIQETCQACSDNCKINDKTFEGFFAEIDYSSILEVAEKLIKEL